MDKQIENILDQYYNYNRPVVTDIKILDESLDAGILCVRWREEDAVITVKSIVTDTGNIITQLK